MHELLLAFDNIFFFTFKEVSGHYSINFVNSILVYRLIQEKSSFLSSSSLCFVRLLQTCRVFDVLFCSNADVKQR